MYPERFLRWLAYRLGLTENMRQFRERIGDEMIAAGRVPHPEQAPRVLRREISDAKERAEETYWSDVGMAIGPLSSALGWFGIQVGGVTILTWAITLVTILHVVTVGILAYDAPTRRTNPVRLEFMRAWNDGALSGRTAKIGTPIVGISMSVHQRGFELGMLIVRAHARGNL